MYYCETCHLVSEHPGCDMCGRRRLRAVRDGDFCLLIGDRAAYCEMLTGIFKEEGIPYTAMPYGRATRIGVPLEHYKLYVPFGSLEKAKEIMRQIEDSGTENLREILLENADLLYISPKLEKKFLRRNKLTEDLLTYCLNVIKTAHRIADEGLITSCLKGGHYLFCFADNATLSVNSQTFEILSLTKN